MSNQTFLCTCGHFKEYKESHDGWVCANCDKWLQDHYAKLRKEYLTKKGLNDNRYHSKDKKL